jgi:CubicO group peptidase (beta-lactamase class C family)
MLCDGLGSVSDGISLTPRDLARWGQMHLEQGRFNDQQIVPVSFITDIQKGFDPNAITADSFLGPTLGVPSSMTYRNWFWIDKNSKGNAFCSSGYLGQWCYILPKFKTVIVKVSTWKLGDSWTDYFAMFRRDIEAFRRIAEQLEC